MEQGPRLQLGNRQLVLHPYAAARAHEQAGNGPHLFRAHRALERRVCTHSWIVLKEEGVDAYERWDKVGWGQPVRRNNYAPDGRWYGNDPRVVHEVRGEEAAKLIPKIRAGIAAYAYSNQGDYRVWPGPNSNTFIAAVLANIPELAAILPPTAIGKDFPHDGRWFGWTPSGTGFRISIDGYAGLTLAWVEGLEVNILGAVVGVDFRNPALKIPGFGRVGV